MYCTNCGNKIDNGANFCVVCGSKIAHVTTGSNDTEHVEEDVTLQNTKVEETENQSAERACELTETLVFEKRKMFTYMVYRTTHTEITADDSGALHFTQTIDRLFRKKKTSETKIELSDIKSIDVKVKMDLWDTLYGVFFVILGFFQPAFFLVALMFLYCGYGKMVKIQKKDGSSYFIPVDAMSEDVKKLQSMV